MTSGHTVQQHVDDLAAVAPAPALVAQLGAIHFRPYLPQLEYLELERCGHEPWREQHARAAFAAILCAWLEQAPVDLPATELSPRVR